MLMDHDDDDQLCTDHQRQKELNSLHSVTCLSHFSFSPSLVVIFRVTFICRVIYLSLFALNLFVGIAAVNLAGKKKSNQTLT